MERLADQVKGTIQDIPGITPPIVAPIRETAELHIELRADDLALQELTRGYVANVLQTALQSEAVLQVLEGQRRFDLLVRLIEEYRTTTPISGDIGSTYRIKPVRRNAGKSNCSGSRTLGRAPAPILLIAKTHADESKFVATLKA